MASMTEIDAPATEQDKTIARVVLGGWRIEPVAGLTERTVKRYQLIDPTGRYVYNAPTRYSAALKAEMFIWEMEKLNALLPA